MVRSLLLNQTNRQTEVNDDEAVVSAVDKRHRRYRFGR